MWGFSCWTPSCDLMPPQVSSTPMHYMLPCMSVCSRGYCMCYGGNIPYVRGLGGFSTSVRLLVSFSTSIGCPLCFILYLSCSSLCLISTSTAMSTTPPVTIVNSGMSSLSLVTMAPSSMGLPTMSGQHDVVLPPPLHQDALEVFLAMPLCHSSNLHLQCLFRPMPIMPWVLHR